MRGFTTSEIDIGNFFKASVVVWAYKYWLNPKINITHLLHIRYQKRVVVYYILKYYFTYLSISTPNCYNWKHWFWACSQPLKRNNPVHRIPYLARRRTCKWSFHCKGFQVKSKLMTAALSSYSAMDKGGVFNVSESAKLLAAEYKEVLSQAINISVDDAYQSIKSHIENSGGNW